MSGRKSRTFNLSEWGRMIVCGTCLFLPPLAIDSCFYGDLGIACGVYGIVISILIYPFVYPLERLGKALWLPRKYLLWGAILMLLSSFLWFSPPTLLGGFGFAVGGLFYMIGSLIGEKYSAPRAPPAG